MYGPYDREQTLISTAVIKMIGNEDTEFSPCDQMWDYIYADDAARAIFIVSEKGKSGEVYVIGSGEAHPLRTYIKIIADKTNYSKTIGFGRRPYNEKQVMYLQADITELKKLGFSPCVSFEEGITKTIQYHYRLTHREH